MAISIAAKALKSRAVRKTVGKVRKIKGLKSEDKGGGLGKILNFGGSLVSGIFKGLGGLISWGWSALWGGIVSASTFLYHFDWNATDEQLNRQIEQGLLTIAGATGGTFGNTLGFVVGGVLPSLAIMKINPGLGRTALANVTKEGLEELAGNLSALTSLTIQALFRAGAIQLFKGTRNLIKRINSGDSKFANWMRGNLPGMSKGIQSWGEENAKPWSFALKAEETIDKIDNKFLRTAVEEFWEELWEGVVEAGYVVAGTADAWHVSQKAQSLRNQGKQRILEIQPNREIEDERIILAGSENNLKGLIPATLAHYQMIEDRDVGQWMGEPVRDYLRANPKVLSLKIQLFSVAQPPWKAPPGQKLRRVSVEIPDVKRSKLDWNTIKRACGGKNGYLWGRFRATANLDNGRQMAVYGGSAEVAEDRIKAFLELSSAELLGLTISEEKREGNRKKNRGMYKETTRIYPGHFTILNQPKVANEESGRTSLTRHYTQRQDKLSLWEGKEEEDFDERLRALLVTPGSNG